MNHDYYTDDHLRSVLRRARRIAVVGASTKWNRPSSFVMKYLMGRGFTIYPVNPKAAGQKILGQPVYSSLGEVPAPFEMVDVFRSSDAAVEVVDDALRLKEEKGIEIVWMQLAVRNDAAAGRAEEGGLTVIMDRCPKIEWSRLHGELSWGGLNSKIIDSQRPRTTTHG